jgi:hypothetical protein
MELVHLAIYPIQDLAGPVSLEGFYPAAFPSPTLKGGQGIIRKVVEEAQSAPLRLEYNVTNGIIIIEEIEGIFDDWIG